MKPHRLLTILCLLLAQFACTQGFDLKNTLTVALGASFPTGSFASSNFSNLSAGLAGPGELARISFDHPINERFTVSVTALGLRNGLNKGTMQKDLSKYGFLYYLGNPTGVTYPDWDIQKRSWYLESVQIGLSTVVPLMRRAFLVVRASAGPGYAQMPEVNAQGHSDTSYSEVSRHSGSAFALVYSADAGVKYMLNEKIFLLADIGYFGSGGFNFKKAVETFYATSGGLNVPGIYSLSNSVDAISGYSEQNGVIHQVSSLLLSVGIGFRLKP